MTEIKRTNIESLGKIFTFTFIEDNVESEETFYIYTYHGIVSIKWNDKVIHLQPLKVDKYNLHPIHVRRSGKPELQTDEIMKRIKSIEGMSKVEFAIYCLDMLKLYHEIVELLGYYPISGSDDEWSKSTRVYLNTPYSRMEIGSVGGSMSGFSPQIDGVQQQYFTKLHVKES